MDDGFKSDKEHDEFYHNGGWNMTMLDKIDFSAKDNPNLYFDYKGQCGQCVYCGGYVRMGNIRLCVGIPPECKYRKEVENWFDMMSKTETAKDAADGCPFFKRISTEEERREHRDKDIQCDFDERLQM